MQITEALVVVQVASASMPHIAKAVADLIAAFTAAGIVTDEQLASARAHARKSIEDLKTVIDQDLQP